MSARAQAEFVNDARFDDLDAAAEVTPSRFKIITDDDLERQVLPEALIEGLVSAGSYVSIVGDPGSLKSFLALDFAYHIATGRPWAGRRVKQGPVLYILAEGKGQFSLRTMAWKQVHGREGGELRFIMQPVQLAEPGQVGELLLAIAALPAPPIAVIVDTRARCAVGINENDATETGEVTAGIDRIRTTTGAAIFELHHTPRGEERERGSTALRAATDTLIHCGADGDFLTVSVKRQKDLDEGDPIMLRKRVVELPNGRTSLVLVPLSEAERRKTPAGLTELPKSHREVLEAIGRGSIKSNKQLATTADVSERALYRAMRALREQDLITRKGWHLTAKGAALVNPDGGDLDD